MYLGNPLLPISVTAASAAESIKEKLAKKNWHEYEQRPLKLNLVPYFLFNYHYFVESDDTVVGHKVIKRSVDGILTIDAHAIEIREDLVQLLKENWKKGNPELPRGDFEEKWCNIEKRDAEEILRVKTAQYFGVPKNNVVISVWRKMFLPLYKTTILAGKKEYSLIVNAVDGNISGLNNIPDRERGYIEITQDTINDLKNPRNWINYSIEALKSSTSVVVEKTKEVTQPKIEKPKKNSINLTFLDSKWFLLLIIILGLFLIYIGLFKIRPI